MILEIDYCAKTKSFFKKFTFYIYNDIGVVVTGGRLTCFEMAMFAVTVVYL